MLNRLVHTSIILICSFLIGCVDHTADNEESTLIEASSEPEERPTQSVKFGGLYKQLGPQGGYLRFFEDGTVLSVTSSGNPQQVARWLIKDGNGNYGEGKYKVSGDRIVFSTTSEVGKLIFEGSINGQTLNLKWNSQINEKRGTNYYEFVQTHDIQ